MTTCKAHDMGAKLKALRNHGMEPRYYHQWVGGNFRIDAIQAAVLNIKLPHLDGWSAARRSHAAVYREEFAKSGLTEFITLPHEPYADSGLPNHHIYNQFIIRAPKRDELRQFLQSHGIGSEIYYPQPLHLQKCFAYLGGKPGDFPESERASMETLALPIFPELTLEQQIYVVSKIREFYC